MFPGWPALSISSGSVSLCTFSLVMLSEQEISHSIRLKRSRSADKARAEGAPSPRFSICRPRLPPCLSTRDICIFPTISFPFSLSLCTLPQTHHISWFLSELSELHTYFPPLSNCFSFCSHTAISNKCPVKFCFYLALGFEDINECSLLFICSQYSQFYLFYIQTFKRHKTESVEPTAMLAPPLCIMGSHFSLNDCSACLGYALERRLTDASDRKYICTMHGNKHFKQQKIGGHLKVLLQRHSYLLCK